jgi:hypothetical protein
MDEESSRRKKRLVGILLIAVFPLVFIGGWITTANRPRIYRAETVCAFMHPQEDEPRAQQMFERARKSKYAVGVAHTTRLELLGKASGEWFTIATDTNPGTAAQSANDLTYALMRTLGEETGSDESRVRLHAPAKPNFVPEKLELLPVVKYGLQASISLAILGLVMVVRTRRPRVGGGTVDGRQHGPTYDY